MILRLLIDECLSPDLVGLAVEAGYVESTCVRDRGILSYTDRKLMDFVLAHDFMLVTNNSRHFRGGGQRAPGGLYATTSVHAGLLCLNSYRTIDLRTQRKMFRLALDVLAQTTDWINQVLEITEQPEGAVTIVIYEHPRAGNDEQ